MSNTIHIKNMVCPRCIKAVSTVLQKLGIPYTLIKLGEVELVSALDLKKKLSLSIELQDAGFSLINDRKSQLIEQMKSLVVQKIHHSDEELDIKWPDFISDKLNLDYKYLSSLFSSVESITFEQYIINQKIERVKELIVYDELTLSEIAFQLHYSSVAYLSNQFKKVTGMTPTQFKKSVDKNRKSLDEI
ncbi:MAG: helix-turn-helix transcriptional regulator [Arenibacter algicola]|jgi:AraC-like DNA-binding protein|nr:MULTISPECIES: AraC family transcriptional regulator [Arenibacter]MBD3661270.1 helix-turn-helix transcriptional regulator [Arenibacter algicola]MCM4164927.1 AraC family transcriptional regulator [Arenibacter sp. A80]RFT55342.1 AraC family transcriptional regulator [Arenibacter sp. P308M17]|tara:strand:+ start:41222 stop:41788 length:567 start_codon:yes stop_codon:yes gene_type:complete